MVLLERWREGDRSSGEALFGRHFDAVYRFLANRVDGEATDLVQATFLACLEGRDAFRGDASFRTFLFAIARHQLFGHWRERRRAPGLDVASSSLVELAPSPSHCTARAQQIRRVADALDRLPMDLQIALQLYHCEELSAPELAVVLAIPEGTVRSRLRRARESLLALLEVQPGDGATLATSLSAIEDWSDALRSAFEPRA